MNQQILTFKDKICLNYLIEAFGFDKFSKIIRSVSMKDIKSVIEKSKLLKNNVEGKVGMPILMYILGVPGFICIFAWLFFFRNK
jgi:hypothetical protein